MITNLHMCNYHNLKNGKNKFVQSTLTTKLMNVNCNSIRQMIYIYLDLSRKWDQSHQSHSSSSACPWPGSKHSWQMKRKAKDREVWSRDLLLECPCNPLYLCYCRHIVDCSPVLPCLLKALRRTTSTTNVYHKGLVPGTRIKVGLVGITFTHSTVLVSIRPAKFLLQVHAFEMKV